MKQVIVWRNDLKVSKGKLAAQCCHASLKAYRKAAKQSKEKWHKEGEKKVVLKAASKEELLELERKVKKAGLPSSLIKDAGFTELPEGTITALGIGPAEYKKIDQITGKLPTVNCP